MAVMQTDSQSGATLTEVLMVFTIAAVLATASAPVTATVLDASRARHAAAFLSARFRLARQEAIGLGTSVGVVFDRVGDRWSMRVCRDGGRNGLRRTDIASGADACPEGPYRLTDLFPGVDIAVDAALRGPAGEPGNPDPIRFGAADIVSFSPMGSCTSGTAFVRSRGGAQYAVRVAGGASRIRVLGYEPGTRTWKDR